MSKEDALQNFIFWKQANGLSDLTIADYKRHVTQFFTRYPDTDLLDNGLEKCLFDYFSDKSIKATTYNNRLVYLTSFFNWCCEQGILLTNPLSSVKKRKAEGRIVNIDESVLKKLLKLPNQNTFAGLRDYTLILLTLDTGIRPKEALSLSVNDVNTTSLEIYIRSEKAKTRVSRTLPISKPTIKAIRELLMYRPDEWGELTPLFCTYEGKPLNRHTWGDRLEMYSKGLGVHIRPYDLRHAFALEFLRSGANAFLLQKTLGHSDLTMTKRYVALTNQDLRNQHNISSPVNKLLPSVTRIKRLR